MLRHTRVKGVSDMDAKEYLQQVRNAEILINDKTEELAELETLAIKINALNEGERVQSSGSQDKMADVVCKIADLKTEIQAEIDNLLRLKREVRNVINRVSEPVLMSVLHKRYLQYKSWEEIAVEMSFTYRWCTQLHGKALLEVDGIIKSSY